MAVDLCVEDIKLHLPDDFKADKKRQYFSRVRNGELQSVEVIGKQFKSPSVDLPDAEIDKYSYKNH